MKAIILARVSSKEQEDGHSLDAQIQSCFEYAIKKGFHVLEQFKVIESSKAIGRPEFLKMINFVKSKKEKLILLCYCVDRLQRDFDEQYLELQKLIKQDKVEIHYVNNNYIEHKNMDSNTKFRKGLDVLLAHDYSNKISENVKRSIKKKLQEGTILTDSPLGYLNTKRVDKDKEKANVYIDPIRGEFIKLAFEKYATGLYSMNEICILLANKGLRSKKGFKVSKSQIQNMLQNPFYYGYMKYNNNLHKHIYPALISKELFDECQNVRLGKINHKSKRTEKQFILKGLLRCQHCKCAYSPELKKGKYTYMRPTKSRGNCEYCYHLNENKILPQIEEQISKLRLADNILLEIEQELNKNSHNEHKTKLEQKNKLQTQLEILTKRLKKARALFLDDGISKEEYNDLVQETNSEKHDIEGKLQRLTNNNDNFDKAVLNIFNLASKASFLFKSSELQEKREIISILFTNLEMDSEKLVFEPRKPFDVLLNSHQRPNWLPEQGSNLRPAD